MISVVEIERDSWDRLWEKVPKAPLMQSWEYGEAKRRAQKWMPRRYVLESDAKKPIGLLQVLCLSLPVVGGVARINRGPVCISESWQDAACPEAIRQVMIAVRGIAKRKRWWYLRIAPGFVMSEEASQVLRECGFRRRPGSAPGSALVTIDRSAEEIRAGFHSVWRRHLKNAEEMDLVIETPDIEGAVPYLMEKYAMVQEEKHFSGIPAKLLSAMARQRGLRWDCRILFARRNGERVGGAMFVGHGDTCTYLVGWTPELGRKLLAMYFIFWNAILLFRNRGFRFFDVGGLDADTLEGIARFKRKLNGRQYTLLGEYDCWSLPFQSQRT